MLHIFHKWSTWEDKADGQLISIRNQKPVGIVVIQHRYCMICNKLQMRRVTLRYDREK